MKTRNCQQRRPSRPGPDPRRRSEEIESMSRVPTGETGRNQAGIRNGDRSGPGASRDRTAPLAERAALFAAGAWRRTGKSTRIFDGSIRLGEASTRSLNLADAFLGLVACLPPSTRAVLAAGRPRVPRWAEMEPRARRDRGPGRNGMSCRTARRSPASRGGPWLKLD